MLDIPIMPIQYYPLLNSNAIINQQLTSIENQFNPMNRWLGYLCHYSEESQKG